MQDMTRRKFIRTITVLGGAVALVPMAACADHTQTASGPTGPIPAVPKGTDATAPDTTAWSNVGPVSGFALNVWSKATFKNSSAFAYVKPTSATAVTALSPACTHRGCPVNYSASDKTFTCPCHGGQFDDTGTNIGGPPKRPLASLATKVDDSGNLLIQPPAHA